MANLYIYPSAPGKNTGYGIAVNSDMATFPSGRNDYNIFLSNREFYDKFNRCLYINRYSTSLLFYSFIKNGYHSIIDGYYLLLVMRKYNLPKTFDYLFIGDSNLYNISKYVNSNHTIVRFHNLYLKVYKTIKLNHLRFYGLKLLLLIYRFKNIEESIVKDYVKGKFDKLYTITDEENKFLQRNYNVYPVCLPINVNPVMIDNSNKSWNGDFIWIGSLSSHKLPGMRFFLEKIYLPLTKKYNLTFKMYGRGTERFHNAKPGVCGYGFVDNIPFDKLANYMFVNPDINGGGLKLKMLGFYKYNFLCISTKLGIEGLNSYVDKWQNLKVLQIHEWYEFLSTELKYLKEKDKH